MRKWCCFLVVLCAGCEPVGGGNTPGVGELAASVQSAHVLGGPAVTEDTLVGAMVGDAAGNLFVSGNVNGWHDRFSEDISLARINADASLAWHKVWSEEFEQLQPDPGQNAESGGGAGALALDDTSIYLVGRRSQSSANSVFQTLLLKVSKDTGELIWARAWSPTADSEPQIASASSQGYAVDVHGDLLLVTGVMSGEIVLLGLNTSDGSLRFQVAIDVFAGFNDRGYVVRGDGADTAWIGGLGDGQALLLKLTGLAANLPEVSWASRLELGVGSNVNDIALDASGHVYLSLDRRGATTYFSSARLRPDGTLDWMKTFDPQNLLDRNNTHMVRLLDGALYVGGRMGFENYDEQMGDGFLMQLEPETGALVWAAHYYTEAGGAQRVEHRVKGVARVGGGLAVGLQSYTAETNLDRYEGSWFTPPAGGLIDDTMELTDVMSGVIVREVAEGTVHSLEGSTAWLAPPSSVTYEALETRTGNGSDGDTAILQITPR